MRRLARASFAGSNEGTGVGRGRFRRAFATLAGVGSLALVMALALVPAASAAPWGFEQVTPVNKGGGSVSGIDTFQTSPDGERFLYTAILPFDEVMSDSVPLYTRYLATRGDTKWNNRALDPPYKLKPEAEGSAFFIMGVLGSSWDLSQVVVISRYALTPDAVEGSGNLYVRDTTTGEYTLIVSYPDELFAEIYSSPGAAESVSYVSPDGREVIFSSVFPLVPDAPIGSSTEVNSVYRWTAEDGIEGLTYLPSDEEEGKMGRTAGSVGGEGGARLSFPQVGANDHFYFHEEDRGVWVRTGSVTKRVSVSRIPETEGTFYPARLDAISDNGRYALFETTTNNTPLLPDPPVVGSRYLYRYDVVDDSLTYVGTSNANFRVIQMSRDGQTVAFFSRLPLGEQGITNRQNAYVWRDGTLNYVWTADPSSNGTGSVRFIRDLSESGRYLAFSDNSKSLAERFGFDNTSIACPTATGAAGLCDQMYLFDADAATEQLQCVSCRKDGEPPRGRSGDPQTVNTGTMRMNRYQRQNVADDGTIYFSTADDLLPAEDSNGSEDVYAYKEGDLRLVSRATQGTKARFLDATPDGKTVFISTNDPIAPTDNDRAVDIYMTREGAGFPYEPPVVKPPCVGTEACHDGLSPRSAQGSAGSASFQGPGNEIPLEKVTVIKPKQIRGATARLRVKVPAKGKVTVTGKGVKKATKAVARAGTVTVEVRLDAKGREALDGSGGVRRTVRVSFKSSDGRGSSVTVQVVYGTQASKKGGH